MRVNRSAGIIKRSLGAVFLSSVGTMVHAGAISFDSTITGADMAGMSVTAKFVDGTSETLVWQTLSEDLGSTGNEIVDHQGFSGGVYGTGWDLTQSGFTLGEYNAGNIYGAWAFNDTSDSVKSITIKSGNSGILFDTKSINDLSEDSNGSGQGRKIFAFDENGDIFVDYSASYSNQDFQELYKTLKIELDDTAVGSDFLFWSDTDKKIEDDSGTSEVVVVVNETVSVSNEEVLNETLAAKAEESNYLSSDIGTALSDIDPDAEPEVKEAAVKQVLEDSSNSGSELAKTLSENDDIVKVLAEDPTLLNDVSTFDVTNLPESGTPEQEERLAKVIEVVEEVLEAEVKKEWVVEGNGDIDLELDRESGDVAIGLAVENEQAEGEPLVFSNLMDTPEESFFINFNLMFQTLTGSLELSLNDILLDTFYAEDYQNVESISYLVEDETFWGLDDALLKFSLFPGSPSSAFLSGIDVSYGYTPPSTPTEVAEPSVFALFGVALSGLCFIRRRNYKENRHAK